MGKEKLVCISVQDKYPVNLQGVFKSLKSLLTCRLPPLLFFLKIYLVKKPNRFWPKDFPVCLAYCVPMGYFNMLPYNLETDSTPVKFICQDFFIGLLYFFFFRRHKIFCCLSFCDVLGIDAQGLWPLPH